jgi:hypothetical protein
MPWINDIDDTRPTDLEFVSEGAERFRELKRALIERLSTAYADFPDEYSERAGDKLLFPIASVMVGTAAQRPEAPYREGHVWISEDTGEYWYGNKDLEWKLLLTGGTDSSTPVLNFQTSVVDHTVSNVSTGDTPGLVIPLGNWPAGFRLLGVRFRCGVDNNFGLEAGLAMGTAIVSGNIGMRLNEIRADVSSPVGTVDIVARAFVSNTSGSPQDVTFRFDLIYAL